MLLMYKVIRKLSIILANRIKSQAHVNVFFQKEID